MIESNRFAVDLHCKVISDGLLERARRSGLDAIVYAPHFTRWDDICETARAHSSEDLLVIPGREIFTGSWENRKHVLALDLDEPIPDFITLEGAMAELKRQDAVVLTPHPDFATVSLDRSDLQQYREQIDAIEVFNPKHLPWHNRRANRLATALELAPFTSSYAHLERSVGVAYTAFDSDITDRDSLLAAIRDGAARTVVHESGRRRWMTSLPELAHLLYENSWVKVDRVLLSGMEPTHPRHRAYDDRFDDVAVY